MAAGWTLSIIAGADDCGVASLGSSSCISRVAFLNSFMPSPSDLPKPAILLPPKSKDHHAGDDHDLRWDYRSRIDICEFQIHSLLASCGCAEQCPQRDAAPNKRHRLPPVPCC